MPARVVLVHDDLAFLAALEAKLRGKGYDVVAFANALRAFDALINSQQVEVLVTRVQFGSGQPQGIALAQAAYIRRPLLKVVFTALPEVVEHAQNHGVVFVLPVDVDLIAQAVEEQLAKAG